MWMRKPAEQTGEPPVRKDLEADYNKAMSRMMMLRHGKECLRNIIAYQEQEIDRYRTEIARSREVIDTHHKDAVSVHEYTSELIAEGITVDSVLRINKDDALILRVDRKYTKDIMTDLQNEIAERIGMRVVLLNVGMELIGAVEHGSDT